MRLRRRTHPTLSGPPSGVAELSSLAGRTACTFVQQALAQVDVIVLTTHRTDA